MSEPFDPHHKWLGIAPAEQPTNYYRLLGLNLFESDADVIESGSDRQMAHLRSFQTGPRMRECQQLLNEVSLARVTLLDAQKKATYDQALRASLAAVELPPNANAIPLPPEDALPPRAGIGVAASPVVVTKGSRQKRKQAVGLGPMIAGGLVGLVALFALGYGIRSGFQPKTRPAEPSSNSEAEIATLPTVEHIEPVEPPVNPPAIDTPSDGSPTSASIAANNPSPPLNALLDVRNAYECTPNSQPQIAIDSTFDSTKSWRLFMRVDAVTPAAGTLLCWGDSRAGLDSMCIQVTPDHISGWVSDNAINDGGTALPKVPVDWSGQREIEIIHDAGAKVLQVRVDGERHNVAVAHPPRADRPMPIHLGGIGMGSLQAFPCSVHELRLEQLTGTVNLPPPSKPTVAPPSELAANGGSVDMPVSNGSLSDLVNSPESSKLPVPNESELQAARQQIQALFANDLSQQRTPQESAALADKLIEQANQSGTQPAIRYALFDSAIDVAGKSGAVDAASRAIKALDAAFLVDLVKLKATAALQLARVAKDPWEFKAVVELLEVVIVECVADDRFDLATPLSEAAASAARNSKDPAAISRTVAQSREIRSLNAKYAPIQEALTLLDNGSDDPAANEIVGRYLCLVKGKWSEGLPYLLKSNTSELRDVAARDNRKPTDPESQTEIGNEWINVATQLDRNMKLQALLRAEYWYRMAVDQLSGLKKLPLETHIRDLGKDVGELAKCPDGAVLVMTFEPSTLKRRGYVMDVSQHGHAGAVNGAVLTEGVAGNALGFDGIDDYVEVATTPWLAAPSAFTLTAWVNVVQWSKPGSSIDYIISTEGKGARGYLLRYRSGGIPDLTLGTSGWRSALSTKTATLGQWHHMAGTFDGQTAKVFLDGEIAGEEPIPVPIVASNIPFRIGQSAHSKDRGVHGRIDEVAVFNRALSEDEVRTLFRIGQAGRPLME